MTALVAGALGAALLAVAGLSIAAAVLAATGVILLAVSAIARLRHDAGVVPVALSAIVGLGLCAAAWQLTPERLTVTDVVIVAPPAEMNGPATETANCLPSSSVSDRIDALRCFSETSGIVDPCFTNSVAEYAWCPSVDGAAEMFSLEGAPQQSALGDVRSSIPWAIQLENGERCRRVSKTVEVIDGEGIFHLCDAGTEILGEVDTSNEVWTVLARSGRSAQFERLQLKRAWK
ncbi:MAG: hypothetical protein R2710_25765 [Acidimicrobiales bacterium]